MDKKRKASIKWMRMAVTVLAVAAAVPLCGAWSSKGHQVAAYIAKCHLTPRTYAAVDSIMNGYSIVYWASWLDGVRNDSRYSYTSTWHYINVDADETYETRYHDPAGDAVSAIEQMRTTLSDPSTSVQDKELAIKIATHVVADLHQPMHAGHASDLGGNRIRLYYEGESTNLHSLWDYTMVEDAHDWSYYEWRNGIDRLPPEQEAEVMAGSVDDWACESVSVAGDVYAYFHANGRYDSCDVDYWTPTVEWQLLKAGLRLARYFNEIFDPASAGAESLEVTAGPVDIYSLEGLRVVSGAWPEDEPWGLRPGIYIAGGRKLLVVPTR